MAAKSLQQRLFTFLIISLLIVSGAFWLAIAFSTNNHVTQQINSNLNVAEKVFMQLLREREQQLINSALVLTDDFGFKQAVATNDSGTIESVLINHGNRIAADTIFLLNLSAEITAAPRKFQSPPEITEDTATEILEQGGAVDYLLIDGLIYQIVLVPVNAPTPIAIAAIGFKLDQKLADSLKDITQLNVSFLGRHQGKVITVSSSGAFPGLAEQTNIESQQRHVFRRANFAYKQISLKQSDNWQLDAFLSVSMKSAFAEFDMLQVEIFAISIVAILLMMIVGAKGTRMLSTPLRTLADTATRIAQGKFNEAIQTDRKISEISDLANAFDVMQKGLAERETKIIFHSRHDALTGLFTRQHAINEMQAAIDSESYHTIVVISINIVRFKDTNDAFGHEVGDACLKLIAQRINGFNGKKFLAARLGGDEFLVAIGLDDTTQSNIAQLQTTLSEKYQVQALSIPLKFVLGCAKYPQDGDAASSLMQKASSALDIARRDKLDIAFYDKNIEQEHLRKLSLLADLRDALKGNSEHLFLCYQPKTHPLKPELVRFEALIRWIHPSEGFVPPDFFIPLAEQAGLIEKVTDWVIRKVVQQIAEWKQCGLNAQVAINLSAKDLSRQQLLTDVVQALDKAHLDRHAVAFEITESEIMQNPEEAIALLNHFRALGFDLAIDDFGTGYSSLSQLKNMPVTELKIDKSFVLKLNELADDQIIVRSTIALAHEFGLKVVAEGVENQESLELLTRWGCDWIQGYYISKPIPAKDVLDWHQKQQTQQKSALP